MDKIYTLDNLIDHLTKIRTSTTLGHLPVYFDAELTKQKEGYLPITYAAIVDTSEDYLAPVDMAILLSGPEE